MTSTAMSAKRQAGWVSFWAGSPGLPYEALFKGWSTILLTSYFFVCLERLGSGQMASVWASMTTRHAKQADEWSGLFFLFWIAVSQGKLVKINQWFPPPDAACTFQSSKHQPSCGGCCVTSPKGEPSYIGDQCMTRLHRASGSPVLGVCVPDQMLAPSGQR